MDDTDDKKSFWTTLPGILTGITGLITAIGGILTFFYQIGVIGSRDTSINKRSQETIQTQAKIEEGLGQLNQQERSQRHDELEKKLRMMEEEIKKKEDLLNQAERTQAQYINISGTWQGPGGLSYIINHSGNFVTVQEISPIYGITAVGQGTINGQNIDVWYTTAIGTTGRALLKVSADGRQINGTITDQTMGISTPITLNK